MRNRQLLNYKVITDSLQSEWVVMIHGAGGSIKTWKYQTERLRSEYNLLLIDLRDHGLSKFEVDQVSKKYSFDLITTDIKKVLGYLKIDSAHFVTLSLGSTIVQHFMMMHPACVNKVVFAGGIFKANMKLRVAAFVAKSVNYLLPYRLMYRVFSFIIMPHERNQKARQIFIKQAEKLTSREYGKWIGLKNSFFKILKKAFHYRFKHDSLVVMGEEDFVFVASAKKYVNQQRYAQYVELPQAGHVCNIEKPDAFNKLVVDFLKKSLVKKTVLTVSTDTN